jgi:hypothetical protein
MSKVKYSQIWSLAYRFGYLGDHPQVVIPPSRSSPKPIFVSGKEKMDGMDPNIQAQQSTKWRKLPTMCLLAAKRGYA